MRIAPYPRAHTSSDSGYLVAALDRKARLVVDRGSGENRTPVPSLGQNTIRRAVRGSADETKRPAGSYEHAEEHPCTCQESILESLRPQPTGRHLP